MPLYHHSEDAPKTLSDVLIVELHKEYCRDSVTLAAHTDEYPIGTVLEKNADGKFVAFSGTADVPACAVLPTHRPASTEDVEVGVIARCASVALSGLAFDDALTQDEKNRAVVELSVRSLVVRG